MKWTSLRPLDHQDPPPSALQGLGHSEYSSRPMEPEGEGPARLRLLLRVKDEGKGEAI